MLAATTVVYTMSTKKDKKLATKVVITTTTTTTVAAKTSPNENNLLPEAAAIVLISVNKRDATISCKLRQYSALVALVIHSIRGDFCEVMRTDVNINKPSVIDLLCLNIFCMF